jgi:hypothetical protein
MSRQSGWPVLSDTATPTSSWLTTKYVTPPRPAARRSAEVRSTGEATDASWPSTWMTAAAADHDSEYCPMLKAVRQGALRRLMSATMVAIAWTTMAIGSP